MARPSPRNRRLSPTAPIKSLADWKRFWDLQETHWQLGQAKFQGGDLLAKTGRTPHPLTPEDFRLRPDSPGYKAGKDLNADVDLVGPGEAYERLTKTPEYQEWLTETNDEAISLVLEVRSSSFFRHLSFDIRHLNQAAGEALTAKQAPTGPAPPWRLVCALKAMSFHCYADQQGKISCYAVVLQ